jgi:hypothetical protein
MPHANISNWFSDAMVKAILTESRATTDECVKAAGASVSLPFTTSLAFVLTHLDVKYHMILNPSEPRRLLTSTHIVLTYRLPP